MPGEKNAIFDMVAQTINFKGKHFAFSRVTYRPTNDEPESFYRFFLRVDDIRPVLAPVQQTHYSILRHQNNRDQQSHLKMRTAWFGTGIRARRIGIDVDD
ncbi:MAG TPA: hypothetical protein DDZ51_02870 [Planctomycetaceae bacterium]|nr:hypothetical protein [Planctomycetaceae bacterium]